MFLSLPAVDRSCNFRLEYLEILLFLSNQCCLTVQMGSAVLVLALLILLVVLVAFYHALRDRSCSRQLEVPYS